MSPSTSAEKLSDEAKSERYQRITGKLLSSSPEIRNAGAHDLVRLSRKDKETTNVFMIGSDSRVVLMDFVKSRASFTAAELGQFSKFIQRTLLVFLQTTTKAAGKNEVLGHIETLDDVDAGKTRLAQMMGWKLKDNARFPWEFLGHIDFFWAFPCIKEAANRLAGNTNATEGVPASHIERAAARSGIYFAENAHRVMVSDYTPTKEDIVNFYLTHTGPASYYGKDVQKPDLDVAIRLIDGGNYEHFNAAVWRHLHPLVMVLWLDCADAASFPSTFSATEQFFIDRKVDHFNLVVFFHNFVKLNQDALAAAFPDEYSAGSDARAFLVSKSAYLKKTWLKHSNQDVTTTFEDLSAPGCFEQITKHLQAVQLNSRLDRIGLA